MGESPLWRCPRCGQRFVARNMPHSCDVRTVDEHFTAASPALRAAFGAFVAAAREHGDVTLNATKSRITRRRASASPALSGRAATTSSPISS